MAAPVVHRETADQYQALGAGLRYGDGDANGWALLHFIDSWAHLLAAISDLVSDSDAGPGWSLLFDVDRCPRAWLPILGVFAGVFIPDSLPDADARARIRQSSAEYSGTVGAFKQAVRESLTGTKTVTVKERDGSPRRLTAQTYTVETPDPAFTALKAELQTPAWIQLAFGTVPGPTWDLVKPTTTWDTVDPTLTWDGVAALLPGDL